MRNIQGVIDGSKNLTGKDKSQSDESHAKVSVFRLEISVGQYIGN